MAWKATGTFWKHSNVNTRNKIHVYNAIIQAILLYGLETAQLNPSNLQRLNAFQLKGLRQILKVSTTFVDRTHTNSYVLNKAKRALTKPGGKIEIVPTVSDTYRTRRRNYMAKLLLGDPSTPEFTTTFIATPWIADNKRVGRPKNHWALHACQDLWVYTRNNRSLGDARYDYTRGDHRTDLLMGILLHPDIK